jgi:hypothetical protein
MYLWQGFDYRWDGVPHRLSMLAAGISDPGSGHRMAALYPGINGDTARLAQSVVRLEGLPDDVRARPVVLDLSFRDAPRGDLRSFRSEGGDALTLPLDLPEGDDAEVVLQGVEWFPAREDGVPHGQIAGSAAIWPTHLELAVDGRRGPGGYEVTGQVELVHEAAADFLKPPARGPNVHNVRLHALVVHGPAGRVRSLRHPLHAEVGQARRHIAPLELARRVVQVDDGLWVPFLRGVRLRLFTAGGRRQGRYLKRVAATVTSAQRAEGAVEILATGGWRGGGLPSPPAAFRQAWLDGGLLGLPAQVRAVPDAVVDVVRYQLKAGSAGRRPAEPHLLVDDATAAARFGAAWGRALAG